jgi:nitrate reductase gamma subunit
MIDAWLSLPLPELFLSLAGFFAGTAALLLWLTFGRLTRHWIKTFDGVVPDLFSAIMVMLAILIGFLATDVWDRNKSAATAVETESASLTTLNALALASGLPADGIRRSIREYVGAVTEKEWPSMASEKGGAKEAENALGALLRTAAAAQHGSPDANGPFDRLLLDMALKVQSARADRLVLSGDYSESVKWACVLILALTGQICIAIVHLERPRPQIAATVIFTSSVVLILALIAAYEGPFQPPISVSAAPIAKVAKLAADAP